MKQHCSKKHTNKLVKPLGSISFLITSLAISPLTRADFPDVHSMLEATRLNAAANSADLNATITLIDALPAQQRLQAYNTLSPRADLSLIAASNAANRTFAKRLNRRLLDIRPESGVASGDEDEWDDIFDDEEESTSSTSATNQTAKATSSDSTESNSEATTTDTPEETVEVEPDPVDQYFSFSEEEEEENPSGELINGAWAYAYGSDTGYKNRGDRYGWDAILFGGFIGKDWQVNPRTILGISGGYAQSDVDARDPTGSYMDIKRLSGSVYGYYSCPTGLYGLGIVTLAHNDFDNNRKILIRPVNGLFGVSKIAHADFSAWETHALAELGYDWQCKDWLVQPKVFSSVTHLSIESYQEMDAGNFNLNVRNHDITRWELGTGFLTEYQFHFQRAVVAPFLHAYYLYDFLQDKQFTVSKLQGGGFDFLTQGAEPGGSTIEVGGGISVHSYKDVMFDMQYDYAARSGFDRHTVSIKIRYQWA